MTRPGRMSAMSGFRAFHVLTIPNYRVLWIGMIFAVAGMQIDLVARTWLAYSISGSGFALGLVAIARGLPQLLLAPIGGTVADRFDRHKLLVASQFVLFALGLLNALLVHFGVVQIWQLVLIGLGQGCVFPFNMPARTTYITDLVDDERLPAALAMDSTGRNLNRVIGPTIGGLLIAWSPTAAFYAIALGYLIGGLLLLPLPRGKAVATASKGLLSDTLVGFRYLRHNRTVMILIGTVFLLTILGMPYQELLPVFQQDVLHVGARSLGLLYAAAGIGALAGSLAAVVVSESPRMRLIQLAAGFFFGVSLAWFAFSTTLPEALMALVVAGFMSQSYFTMNRIMVIQETDKAFYGRVMSVYMMTWALMPVAVLPMGALVDQIGAPLTVGGAGVLLALAIAAATIFGRESRAIGSAASHVAPASD